MEFIRETAKIWLPAVADELPGCTVAGFSAGFSKRKSRAAIGAAPHSR